MGVQLNMKLCVKAWRLQETQVSSSVALQLENKVFISFVFEIVCPNLGFTDSAMLVDQLVPWILLSLCSRHQVAGNLHLL